MNHSAWKLTVFALAAVLILGGCDLKRRSGSGDGGSGSDGGHGKAAENFVVDDSGTARLLPPDDLQQRQGKEVTDTTQGGSNAQGSLPGSSWIYDDKNNGFFLVAAASKPGTNGGDMIRRVDLGSNIKEFDFDKELAGAQGAYIYVPDEMRNAVPSKYIDADGLYSGIICGFVPGPNKTVIALSAGAEGGVGFVLNPYEEASAFTPLQAIKFPYGSNACRGVYSDALKKLYVIDVARVESQAGQTGVFVADIYNDNRGMIASYYAFDLKNRINSHSIPNFQDLEIYNDALFLLSGNGRFDAEWDTVVYYVPLNGAGEPIFANYKYTRTNNPIVRADGCAISSWNLASLAITNYKGKPVLLTTGTTSIMAWEINSDGELKKIDMNPNRPGIQGLSTVNNGQGGLKMAYSPDGKTIYSLPHCRSGENKIKLALDGRPEFVFSATAINAETLEQKDPIDIDYRDFLKNLKGVSYLPQFSMTTRDFAVGKNHMVVLGSSASNLSGLNAGADISIIDLKKKTNITFNKPDSRTAHEKNYGFKLAQGDPKFERVEQNSHAAIWVP
ncbi:MAG: hypothetical protein II767_05965 [Proteobacteria bacterium]|nr:hypothetical protein [Pseudomonadota bacterium]MBQ4359783.1 hypothetical protein [Pseudomonadota bacterium]